MKTALITILKYGAIAGNILFVLWVTFNAIDSGFAGTTYEKISYAVLIALFICNAFLLIRSFKAETAKQV